MEKKETEIFYPKSQTAWRTWLEKNHLSNQAVWLVFYNKKSEIKSIIAKVSLRPAGRTIKPLLHGTILV